MPTMTHKEAQEALAEIGRCRINRDKARLEAKIAEYEGLASDNLTIRILLNTAREALEVLKDPAVE
jgi:hypothetical protein